MDLHAARYAEREQTREAERAARELRRLAAERVGG